MRNTVIKLLEELRVEENKLNKTFPKKYEDCMKTLVNIEYSLVDMIVLKRLLELDYVVNKKKNQNTFYFIIKEYVDNICDLLILKEYKKGLKSINDIRNIKI